MVRTKHSLISLGLHNEIKKLQKELNKIEQNKKKRRKNRITMITASEILLKQYKNSKH